MSLSAFVSALGSHEMGRHKLPIIYQGYFSLLGYTPSLARNETEFPKNDDGGW